MSGCARIATPWTKPRHPRLEAALPLFRQVGLRLFASSRSCVCPIVSRHCRRRVRFALVGLTTRLDVVDLLEKRLRSRFSHRQLLFSQPSREDYEAVRDARPALLPRSVCKHLVHFRFIS